MRCLIITNHFFPESFRVNDIAFELARKGHDVTVLTAIPDYPRGKFFDGYGYFRRRTEWVNGVKVVRAAVIPRGGGTAARMVMNYLSVIVSFTLRGLWMALRGKYDYVFVHDTSPAFIIGAGVIVRKLQKAPLDVWILDMWPESLAAGGISSPRVYAVVQRMMDSFYRHSDLLHISSHGFRKFLSARGVADGKIRYLPNWADSVIQSGGDTAAAIPPLPDGRIIMFAGNLGYAQNLENVLKAAELTSGHKDLHWVFVGDGRKRAWMDEFVRKHHLEDTVHLLGRYPIETMQSFFARADIMLVSLSDKPALNITLPAKVQAYMANAKPIMAMMNGEGRDIIKDAQCGFAIAADDVKGMADAATRILYIDKESLARLGQRALDYYNAHFSKDVCMAEISRSMKQLAGSAEQPS